MLAAVTLVGARRRQVAAAQRAERRALSGASDQEGERLPRRKKKKRGCKHDPRAQELAQIIMGALYWITEPTEIDAELGNGLEKTSVPIVCSSDAVLFLTMMFYRFSNFIIVQTFYVPDEYWQSLEVSHHQVFGDGYLTWEWREKIRGYTYPVVFTFLYKVLALLGLDSSTALTRLPRLLQALFSAVGDVYLYKLSHKLAGPLVAQWTLVANCLCWFIFYCSTRTLSNTTEMTLIVIGLYHYQWKKSKLETLRDAHSCWKFLVFAAVSVIIRPTAAVIWIPLCMSHIYSTRHLKSTVITYIVTAAFFLFGSMRIDKAIYGEWTLVPLNFFYFNISQKVSHFYGTHPWHWYVTQGLPFVLTSHLLLLILGWKSCKNRMLQLVISWTILVYSILAHKEFRFILPVLPLCMHIVGYFITTVHQHRSRPVDHEDQVLEQISENEIATYVQKMRKEMSKDKEERDSGLTSGTEGSDNNDISDSELISAVRQRLRQRKPSNPRDWLSVRVIVVLLVITNVPMMVYFGVLHGRGSLDVIKYIGQQAISNPDMKVLFLMPCHSTPLYSHVHKNITMRFLTCEPNLHGRIDHVDEADQFYEAPKKWLKSNIIKHPDKVVYTHIVMYEDLEKDIMPFLEAGKYHQEQTFFFSHFLFDSRQSVNILLYRRTKATPVDNVVYN